jgi:type I restriction enzyme S subunit
LASTNKTTIGQFRVLMPPIGEQKSLLDRLSIVLDPVDAAASRAEREIVLMREYRTRLVADVVTGQLDVREAARNFLDIEADGPSVEGDIEEAELIDDDIDGQDGEAA